MIFKCTNCKKKFHKKPEMVALIETEPYCSKCYEFVRWKNRARRELEKEQKKRSRK